MSSGNSIIEEVSDGRIDNAMAIIGGGLNKNYIEILGGQDAKIADVLNKLVKRIAELQQKTNPIELQFAFALKRDLTNRYASRKLIYQAALDKDLYYGVLVKTLGETAKAQFELPES